MSLFDIPQREIVDSKEILKKSREETIPKIKTSKISVNDRLAEIAKKVEQNLGSSKNQYLLITNDSDWLEYCSKVNYGDFVALDTETTGLDSTLCKLVGVCIQSQYQKPTYIPVGHISTVTGMAIKNQVSLQSVYDGLNILVSKNVKFIYHNAYFDRVVVYNTVGILLPIFWDTLLAAKLLNENEEHSLKTLYSKYCSNDSGVHKFSELFDGIAFCYIPYNTGYIYGAHDAEMTLSLYYFQKDFLTKDSDKCKKYRLDKICDLYYDIEIPLNDVLVDMKIRGIKFDFDKSKELKEKYTKLRENYLQDFNHLVEPYEQQIKMIDGMEYPVNFNSPKQLSILLYDIIGAESVDPKSPRGTGESVLSALAKKDLRVSGLVNAILKVKEIDKLIGTFIDKLTNDARTHSGRVYGNFTSMGAATGRFSSSNPNLQQCPSKHSIIRNMFRGDDGEVVMGFDYSKQELLVAAITADDERMLDSFRKGLDLYSYMASKVYNLPYEECVEFYPDGSVNKEGKNRRKKLKSLVLAINYSMSTKSLAEKLSISLDEAQNLKNLMFQSFPDLKACIDGTIKSGHRNGYVESLSGYRRRLPDLTMPRYSFVFAQDMDEKTESYYESLYTNKLDKCWGFRSRMEMIDELSQKGVYVTDNTGTISKAERECFNAIIQGESAVITKRAMVNIYHNERLKELGAKLILTIHDEVCATCPKDNAYEVSQIIKELMIEAGVGFKVPLSVDVAISECWDGESMVFDKNKKLVREKDLHETEETLKT